MLFTCREFPGSRQSARTDPAGVDADLLIGLRATDLIVVGASTVAMLMVAALAAILPAVRAARVDPLTAIRSE
jgi:ABC-type lipoprotein release transport system permease subunit